MTPPNRLIEDARLTARRDHGSHLCHFYRSREEYLELLPPFFGDGVENGELGIWVLPDWLPRARAVQAVRSAGPRLERALDDGTFRLRARREIFDGGNGKLGSADAIVDLWRAEERAALERGFLGLRVSCDSPWEDAEEGWRAFLAYERHLEACLQEIKIVALCAYGAGALSAVRLEEILDCHESGIFRGKNGWREIEYGADAAAAESVLGARCSR